MTLSTTTADNMRPACQSWPAETCRAVIAGPTISRTTLPITVAVATVMTP